METVSVSVLGLAPVVTINDKVYGQMTPEAIVTIIDTLEARGGYQCRKINCRHWITSVKPGKRKG